MTSIKANLLSYGGTNASQTRDRIDFDGREPAEWTAHPVTLECPDGYTVAESSSGTRELYNGQGQHVTLLVQRTGSVLTVTADGYFPVRMIHDTRNAA